MKKIIIFCICYCAVQLLQAQHCQYDALSIVGIFPHTTDTYTQIHGLQITLVDANGEPILVYQDRYSDEKSSFPRKRAPLIAWQNQLVDPDIKHSQKNLKRRLFGFAGNNYILTGVFYKEPIFIKIEDIDKEHNGGHFETKIVEITPEYFLKLCGYRFRSPKHQKAYKVFKFPMNVISRQTYSHGLQQSGDYNFDGYDDIRVTSEAPNQYQKWDYFLYDVNRDSYVKDPFLSSMHHLTFNWVEQTFYGSRSVFVDKLTRMSEVYDFFEGKIRMTQKTTCTQTHESSERSDCSIYKLQNGKLVLIEFRQGAE
ncbi:MAG: hypothetical protein AB8B65_14610 [Kordia sp.]|uniref:XAC2610-related protein n=1 Tax=Kordia sp. TaxID=1965332 RepID=UPI00385FB427